MDDRTWRVRVGAWRQTLIACAVFSLALATYFMVTGMGTLILMVATGWLTLVTLIEDSKRHYSTCARRAEECMVCSTVEMIVYQHAGAVRAEEMRTERRQRTPLPLGPSQVSAPDLPKQRDETS